MERRGELSSQQIVVIVLALGAFIIAALFVGIGRVMVGVHYPSDALVGFFIGGLIPYIISRTKMVS